MPPAGVPIAIGSNAVAENTQETSQVVDYEGSAGTSGTVQDDNYGIKLKPSITWSSVALGYSAQAKDGNIAIGAYSDATDTSSATPYVSVGSSTLQRRITNVADGTGNTDVATVGQMNKAIESIGTTGWNLSTNGNSSSTTITSGKTVDFSPAVDGKNGTTDHKNVKISNDGSNVKIGLNKDIVLGEATEGEGGSLNVYSDSTEASNLGNRVSIDGSTVSVNYGKEDGTSGTKRGVVLGVGEDYNNNAQGYIAFNNIDAKGTIGSTYLHSATDAPNDLKGRLVYSNAIDGTEYIANLDDGITFTGDVQKDVPKDYTQTPTKLNTTLNITGGAATEKGLTSGNIGVVSTPAAEKKDGTTQASKLEIKLNKDLKGITSITSQTTDGTTSGATITLGTNGTTISGGDVYVSTHKITGLKDGAADTDAATVGQMKTAIGDAKTKYYSVQEGLQSGGFRTNENNDGASSALAGLAAGYETGTTGIASTVVGSYSGVIGSSWLQGAAAVSVGTVNVNSNTDTSKPYSGVANSIVGQANTTTNSNAAIIYGAGNTVTDSYRPIDPTKVGAILGSVSDPKELSKAMQAAVKDSGGQVMAIGGGNKITSAYKTQVVGLGNTVSDTELNYVEGFNNTVTGGTSNYIIGAQNNLTGGSQNIVFGDNHTLSNKSNNVVIGSADSSKELAASDAVLIGHNADVKVDGGVALGSGSVASVQEGQKGYDPATTVTNKTTAPWTSTKAAVSVGKADGSVTRQITGVAAGTNDTDAVNVAQIKKLASINASNIGANLQYGADGTTAVTDTDKTKNKEAWATAIGTGTVTKDDDGSKQMVTGKTVYDALHGGLDNITVGKDGQNGKDGSIGIAGQNGKDGYSITYIKTEQGAAGVDGKDGITRVVYQDKDGNGKHTFATLDDGLKFKGDDSTVIAKKLNEQLNITGGADSNNLTEGNIGVNSTTDKGQLKVQLAKDLTGITSISNQKTEGGKTTGAKITLGTDGTTTITGGDINVGGNKVTNIKSALDGAKDAKGEDATIATATGDALKNAANLGDLQKVYNDISAKADKASTSHTALTVEGGTKAGKDDEKNKGVYAGKNILLHESTDENGKVTYDLKLAQNLTGITSISNQTTGAKITLGTDGVTTISGGDVSVSGNKITNIKAGDVKAESKDAVNGDQLYNEQQARTEADTAINNKIGTFDNSKTYNYIDKTASISTNLTTLDTHVKKNAEDISQINTRIDTLDGNAVKYDGSTKSKITLAGSDGTTIDHVKDGTISSTSKEAVNGGQLNTEQQARIAADTAITDKIGSLDKNGNYIKRDDSISKNLSTLDGQVKTNADAISKETTDREAADTAINNKIGTFDNSKTYNYIDKTASISTNITTLDTHVKKNAEDISQINTRIDTLDGNAVKYDGSTKSKITLAGSDGTTIDHVKDGTISSTSKEAVNGGQLFAEKTARENVDTEIKTDITKIKDGEGFTNKGQTVIKSLAQDAVDVKGSDYVTVTNETKDGTKTFTVSVDGNGKVDSGDKGLISGDTIYNELRPSADGSYIEKDSTTAQNLVSLDTQVKKTSDLINSDGKTIKIGGSDAATKIDVNGKDGKGRVITGVVSDANDPTSAANVGYVNGVTAANTQQIYRDMNNAYGRLNNNINKAAAGSNALAALHPLDYDPDDKADFAVGYGHYRNANAAAVGAFYHPNENTMVNVGVSLGNGDPGFNAGVSFKVGRGGAGREAMSKTEMAKVINSQSKEIDALKKDNADKDKRIDALEQKMAEILAKLDKNGK